MPDRDFAHLAAINAPIQATSAGIIHRAMKRMPVAIKDLSADMFPQVHDEIIYVVEEDRVDVRVAKEGAARPFWTFPSRSWWTPGRASTRPRPTDPPTQSARHRRLPIPKRLWPAPRLSGIGSQPPTRFRTHLRSANEWRKLRSNQQEGDDG